MAFIETVTTKKLGPEDKDALATALALLNRTQGNGLFGPDYLESRLENPRSLVLSAFLGGELIGISLAEIITNVDYYLPFDRNITSELEGKVVGSFSTLSILEAHQGRGVGQRLSRERIDWLKERSCDVAVGVSWVSGLAHTSNRTFERAGFRAVKKLNDFYHSSSLEKPFDCPGCHAIPCTCAAIFYRKDFI